MKKKNYLEVDYDTRQEKTQEREEDWISSVLVVKTIQYLT